MLPAPLGTGSGDCQGGFCPQHYFLIRPRGPPKTKNQPMAHLIAGIGATQGHTVGQAEVGFSPGPSSQTKLLSPSLQRLSGSQGITSRLPEPQRSVRRPGRGPRQDFSASQRGGGCGEEGNTREGVPSRRAASPGDPPAWAPVSPPRVATICVDAEMEPVTAPSPRSRF